MSRDFMAKGKFCLLSFSKVLISVETDSFTYENRQTQKIDKIVIRTIFQPRFTPALHLSRYPIFLVNSRIFKFEM